MCAQDFLVRFPLNTELKDPRGALYIQEPSEKNDSLGLGIYLSPVVVRDLSTVEQAATWSPQQLAAFGVAAEEISHFHYVAHHAPTGRGVSQLELEVQGDVDRFLLTFFAKVKQTGSADAVFSELYEKLFEKFSLAVVSEERRERYEQANLLARAFVLKHAAELNDPKKRAGFLRKARAFYRKNLSQKIELSR